jgi:O-antigen/teichoic acid export membrane protein
MSSQHRVSLWQDIISNFAGQGWSFLVGMIAVPFYIRFLGVEGYGMVGFYGALRAVFNSFLDFGLTATIKREIARYTVSPPKIGQTRDLVRTLELVYWIIGLILGLVVCFGAQLIANYWINSATIPATTIKSIVVIMGVITFVQWPLTFYQGGLIGLQKIVLLNGVNVIVATLRGVGGVLAVWLFSSPLIAFFVWQVILSLLQLMMTTYLLWRSLPPSPNNQAPRFRKSIIVEIWRFAIGMGGSSFFAFFLGQADKVILSKILTLEHFGYYSIAVTLNEQLQMVNTQIVQPMFPRFSALVAQDDRESLRDLYHKGCQLVSVIILPIAGTAAFFSKELLYLWTQDGQIASIVAPITTLLFVGTIFVNFINIPFSITVAYGWIKLVFFRSLVLSLLVVPLMIFLSLRYGGVGAALTWAMLNLGQLIILPLIIHRRILKGELKRWSIFDVGIPTFVSLTVLGTVRWLMGDSLSLIQTIVTISAAALITFGFLVLVARDIRSTVVTNFMAYFKKLQSS